MESQTTRLNKAVDSMLSHRDRTQKPQDTHKVLLTLDIDMYNRIKAKAEREERSVNGQLRYMLKRAENLG